MNRFFAIAFVLAFFVAGIRGADVDEKDVIVLTDDTFNSVIAENQFILVEFYAPWCGHCKSLVPHYAEAATRLKSAGSPVALAKLDATVHSASASKFEVRGYPTLKFFKNGNPMDYTGGRTANDIFNWVQKKTGPTIATLTAVDEVEAFVAANDLAVVGFFKGDNNAAIAQLSTVADAMDDAKFAVVNVDDSSIQGKFAITEESVVLFRKFPEEPERVVFDGPFASLQIQGFIKANSLPLAVEFTDQSAPKIFGGDIKTHVLIFLNGLTSEESKTTLSGFRQAAAEFKGRALFVIVDFEKPTSARIADYFGVKSTPDIRLIKLGEEVEKYRMEPLNLEAESFISFATSYFEGKLSRYLMSEEPQPYSGTGVRVLTGRDHDELVHDETKNVFVEYYAPWCGHCKKLVPIWDKLAAAFDNVDNVVIAKMDSTANEVASVHVQGFPTLKFYPAGAGRRVVDYSGGREYDELHKYVVANSVDASLGETGDAHDHDHHGHSHDHEL
ncbi:prolyl 4-hydroxylase [Capsaspora owczarzaki ATCC 30864]|uniref:Protein disulfide-isomerase n=1 Tax=Capsaspora owczarzaki (strain ATCC 30864) TaxID=595528 RepID=A0A0D2X5K2_CAPO3|nr:prolyl 4-hydroxylase [Capsaspora owczarzaki ATCC 30864]KJE97954.1 prolyl 4-hydroxylase [Capsaspora owczarzaki ATCC 30864]|eukprot:XP_004342620.1 prolyl 4-hydroxylase [Capsaspora owczarzaki ATCC 30864]